MQTRKQDKNIERPGGARRAHLLLIELVLVLLFFAIVAGACLRMMGEAWLITAETEEIHQALSLVQQGAEGIRQSRGDAAVLRELMGVEPHELDEGVYMAYYDSDWNRQESIEGAPYLLRITIESEPGDLLLKGTATVAGRENLGWEDIQSLDVCWFLGDR